MIYGGIEAGGTKFVCALGTAPNDVCASLRLDTTTPEETLPPIIQFFREREPISAIGIGSFGPVDLNPASETFGFITSTPKPGWRNVDLAGAIRRALQVPVGFDTDVNAAALGEHRWGAAQGLDNFIYLTIGTGIGGGGFANGKLMHGLLHPEMGHIRIPHDRAKDPFSGACPFHGDCLEGLASGAALLKRWNTSPQHLPPDHRAWKIQADYLALACMNFVLTVSPQRIILGGGVMRQTGLLALIRNRTQELLNGYIQAESILEKIDEYIVSPRLGDQAGVLGAMALAMQTLDA